RNAKLIALCGEKGIKRDYSNHRTPQQNGFDEHDTNILVGTQADDSYSECDEQVILVPSFLYNSFSAALLPQANIEIRRNLVPAASDHAGGIVTTGGVPAGSDPAGGIVPTGRVLASSSVPASDVLASNILARSVPAGGVLVGSLVPTDSATSSVPAASVFVPAVVPTDSAGNSPLPPVYSLGSCAHSTRFPSPSDLGNHQHTTGIFSSSSYDDDFYADVTNLDSNVAVDPVATKRVNSIHRQYHILGDLQSQYRQGVPCRKPSSVATALADPDWVAAMQEEMQQFYHKQVWKLVPLPAGKIAISTKWILKNKRDARGIMVYVDDIIFGSTNKAWCDEFEVLIKGEFELSAMGELTFFLGLQVKQLSDGIFISQDNVRTATTSYEVPKHKSKDEPNDAVNVYLFRSMIGSFVYLIASRPDIMFAVSACSRHQDSLFQLEAYSDSDYAGSHGDRKSTTGGCTGIGGRITPKGRLTIVYTVYTNFCTALLPQAKIKLRRNLVPAARDPAGSIVPSGGVPAGNVPTSGVPAGGVLTGSSVPASGVPAGSIPAVVFLLVVFLLRSVCLAFPRVKGYFCIGSLSFSLRNYRGEISSLEKPSSVAKALEDPDWVAAMQEEMQ
nr:ribonuclease H-like domain, reverse transcriptase, RNA-dependent DNA polymerase [Tanacetum cinerariifolium]